MSARRVFGATAAGLLGTAGLGASLLVWLTRQWRIHQLLQRGASPDIDQVQARSANLALHAYLTHRTSRLDSAWAAAGAPRDALLDRAVRHLAEVRDLLDRVLVGGQAALAAAAALAALRVAPLRPTLKVAGILSAVVGAAGLAAATVLFPALFQLYHDQAYETDDWRLPDENLLARLFPEGFYRAAAGVWFAAWAAIGCGLWLIGLLLKRRSQADASGGAAVRTGLSPFDPRRTDPYTRPTEARHG